MNFFKKKKTSFDENFREKLGKLGNQPASIQRLAVPELDVYLEKQYDLLEKQIENHAIDTAEKSRPFENNDQLVPYIMFMAEAAGDWCNHCMSVLQVDGLNDYKVSAIRFAINEQTELLEQKSEIDNEIRNTSRDLREIETRDTRNWTMLPFWIVAIAMLLFGDLIYNAKALQAIGFTYGKALCAVVSIIIGLSVSGFFFFLELKKDETEGRQNGVILFCGVLILLCFCSLGYFRTNYLNEMNDTDISMGFSTLTFVLINILLFGGVSFIFHRKWPTDQETKVHKNRLKMEKKLERLEEKKESVLENMSMLKIWLDDNLQTANDIMGYYNAKLTKNIGIYRKLAANWIREVTTRLTYTPDCFTQPLPRVSCRYIQIKDHTRLLKDKNNADD